MNHLAKLLTKLQKTKRNQSYKGMAKKRLANRLGLERLEERALMAVVAAWTADNTAADSVGANHGTLTSGATYAAGQIAQAFSFDGINDRVVIQDSESFKLTQSLTIEGWVMIKSFGTARGEILFRGDDRGGKDPYQLCTAPDGKIIFSIDSLETRVNLEVANVPFSRFIHVAATLDNAMGMMRVYLDGNLAAESFTSIRPFRDLDPASNPGIGIGNHGGYPATPHNYPFNGLIDELKLYDVALTGAEVSDIYRLGTVRQSTKFYAVNDAAIDETFEYDARGSFNEVHTLSGNNSQPRGAASNAAGDRVWVADANKKVYVYDAAGGPLGSWSAAGLHAQAQIEGITTDGTDVWIVDNKTDKVYRYANAAGLLSASPNAASSFSLNSGNTTPKDLVTDGTSIWVVNDSTTDKVFKYNVAGTLLGSWTINSGGGSPTGITLDPTNSSQSLWIVDSNSDSVYEYATSRSKVSGSQVASVTFALAAGNTNPQGIADPPPHAMIASNASVSTTEKPSRKISTPSNSFIAQVDSIFENWNEDSLFNQTKKRLAGRR